MERDAFQAIAHGPGRDSQCPGGGHDRLARRQPRLKRRDECLATPTRGLEGIQPARRAHRRQRRIGHERPFQRHVRDVHHARPGATAGTTRRLSMASA